MVMGLGVWEIAILLLIVAVIFGAGKLPSVMGDLAKGIKTFKSELSADKAEAPPPAEPAVPPAPMTATAPAPATIDATATRVAVTEPVPPPVRTA
jgi:sec-independent protein translocase protein TatA